MTYLPREILNQPDAGNFFWKQSVGLSCFSWAFVTWIPCKFWKAMHRVCGLAFVSIVGDFLVVAHQLFHCKTKQIHDRVDNKSSAQATYFQSTRDVQLAWLARIVSQNRPLNRVHLQHRSSFWWPFDRWTVLVEGSHSYAQHGDSGLLFEMLS